MPAPHVMPVDANDNVIGASTAASPGYTRIEDGATQNVATVTVAGALRVDGSAVNQPVTGTVTARGFRDAAVTVQASGTPTAPAAGAAIATVTVPAAGMWEVTTTFFLSGTVAAADANNLQVRQNAVVRLTTLPVPAAANVFPLPVAIVLNCAINDTVSVNAVAIGSASAVYNAVIVARQVG